jgi:hypothetical protein
MHTIHPTTAWLATAMVLTIILMLIGCGDSNEEGSYGASDSSDSGITVEAMLDQWEVGDEKAAFDSLLAIDWTDPPLAKDSLLAVSNLELAKEGNISKAAELAQKAQREYFGDWLALGEYALDELDKARADDAARAQQIETSLDAMTEFLKRPEHLGIFQRLGPALEPLAPGEIQLPEGF